MISAVKSLFNEYLSWKTDVNVPTESNKQNKLEKNVFVGNLEVTAEKTRIRSRIRKSSERTQVSGSVPKCHGSGTLLKTQ